ncbi:prolyl oligopeptidase [Sarocladium implicatum]|nr:prolyl oligopeptidase [Sarocladium implicatum]
MLPDPSLSLTIPSLHDSTALDCRVYHPQSLSANPRAPSWQRHAAILAHPYAPLGGCYDDPVLAEATEQLLRSGILVATFNFRGAGDSAGRTSWTGRSETEDYISVIGFIIYYIHYLDPFGRISPADHGSLHPEAAPTARPPHPRLIIGGYSYGSIITIQLPPLEAILQRFASPLSGSAAAQIRLRAQHLATQFNEILGSAREAMLNHRNRSYGSTSLRVGGDEDSGTPRRSSDMERRSFSLEAEEKVRKGLHDLLRRHKDRPEDAHPTKSAANDQNEVLADEKLAPLSDLTIPRPSYLLISPVHGLVKHLALMNFWSSATSHSHSARLEPGEEKLVRNPTLAVYGTRDSFVSVSKLRTWSTRLSSQPDSQFSAVEAENGGHFWVEEGVLLKLKTAMSAFVTSFINGP